jgi:virulence factor
VNISGKKRDGLLYHVSIQLTSKEGNTAIGIMNRDSGTTEEILEVFASAEKMVVYNVSDVVVCRDKNETKTGNNDWQPTLNKRGFEQVISDFLNAVPSGNTSIVSTSNVLASHKLCEDMVLKLSAIQ